MSDRFARIETLYHAALALAPNERAAYLTKECGTDDDLRRHIESLLRIESASDGFFEHSAIAALARAAGATGSMDAQTWQILKQWVADLIELTAVERAAYLAQRCPDPAVREHVLAMLEDPGSISRIVGSAALKPGTPIGPYEIEPTDGGGMGDAMAHERYVIGRELAHGGMGAIHEATDVRLSRIVAVKQLLVRTPHAEARLKREALLTARLQHPAIVPVFDIGERPNHGPFYAMKLVDGMSLDRAIEQAGTLAARLALLPHAIAAVDAVAYAHSHGIVHRDLKPHNVLVGAFGETVVVDWGIAKEIRAPDDAITAIVSPEDQLTRVGTVLGTPTYMAPEQAAGAPVDARADVYALGAVLYHLLSGRRPAPSVVAGGSGEGLGETASRLLRAEPGLPTDLVTIVEKAMAPGAADRYVTAGELAADLRRFQTGQLVGAHHYTPWQLVRRSIARQPAASSLVALVVVALVFAVAMLVVRQVRVRETRETKRVLDMQILQLESAVTDALDRGTQAALEDQLDGAIGRARVASQQLAGATSAVGRGDDPLDRRIHAVLAGFDADTYSIPPRFRNVVAEALPYATRRVTSRAVQDAKRTVWPIITRELDAFGLPRELGYIAWQESDLKASTRGPLGQVGVWQLMPMTAREHGLRVDDTVDERLDVTKSTHVAAQMFAEEFAQFGDDATLMAVLAWEQGEERSRRFVRAIAMEKGAWRTNRRSYWHLLRTNRLSKETEDYVSKIVALILTDRDPER